MIITECYIICDKCNDSFGVDTKDAGRLKQLREAKAAGWMNFPDEDFCPKCVKEIQLKTK